MKLNLACRCCKCFLLIFPLIYNKKQKMNGVNFSQIHTVLELRVYLRYYEVRILMKWLVGLGNVLNEGAVMKMSARLMFSVIALASAMCGILKAEDTFSPPFSNDHYSCRCIPPFDVPVYRGVPQDDVFLVHSKLCEFKRYIRSLENHVCLLEDLFTGDMTSVQQWFFDEQQKAGNGLSTQIDAILMRGGLSENEVKGFRALQNELQKTCVSDYDLNKFMVLAKGHEHDFGKKYADFLWLTQTTQQLSGMGANVRSEIHSIIAKLPLDQFASRMHSKTFAKALLRINTTESIGQISNVWEALRQLAAGQIRYFDRVFADDLYPPVIEKSLGKGMYKISSQRKEISSRERIQVAYLCLKDVTNLVFVIDRCLVAYIVDRLSPKKDFVQLQTLAVPFVEAARGLPDTCDKISSLPISETIETTNFLLRKFTEVVAQLQEQQNADNDFVGWLKGKWMCISLAVGVIIIRTTQYLGSLPAPVHGDPSAYI